MGRRIAKRKRVPKVEKISKIRKISRGKRRRLLKIRNIERARDRAFFRDERSNNVNDIDALKKAQEQEELKKKELEEQRKQELEKAELRKKEMEEERQRKEREERELRIKALREKIRKRELEKEELRKKEKEKEEFRKKELERQRELGERAARMVDALTDPKLKYPMTQEKENNILSAPLSLQPQEPLKEKKTTVDEMIHDRVTEEKREEREKNMEEVKKIKREKQMRRAILENKFLYTKEPLENVSVVENKLTADQIKLREHQQKKLEICMKELISLLNGELENVKLALERLTFLHIEKLKSEKAAQRGELSKEDEEKEKKRYILKGSYAVGNEYAYDIVSDILAKNELRSELPANMKPNASLVKLLEVEKDDIWFLWEDNRQTLNSWKGYMRSTALDYLNIFYREAYEEVPRCWSIVASCAGAIRYTSKILSGLNDGKTKIIIPKE